MFTLEWDAEDLVRLERTREVLGEAGTVMDSHIRALLTQGALRAWGRGRVWKSAPLWCSLSVACALLFFSASGSSAAPRLRQILGPRSIQACSSSLYLLEPEVLGQRCLSCAWQCSIQMSFGEELPRTVEQTGSQ